MLSIIDLISVQSPKDVSAFLDYLKSRNKRHDTRNVDLYKAYLVNKEQLIFGEIGANAFNALKKRLTDQLIEFSGSRLLTHELSSENQVIKLIVLARKLFTVHKDKTGFQLLKRAEKKALGLDHYSLLNEIYHTMIEHAHKMADVEQKLLFEKLEKNNQLFIAEEKLSILYASMQKQFNTENFGVLPSSLHELYDEGLKVFGIDSDVAMSFRSLNQLCILTDLFGSQTKNYHKLDLFFEDMIAPLQGSVRDTDKMLGYHIELLYGMANIYFRKKNAIRSMFYLNQMKSQLLRLNGKFKATWSSRYTNLLALNLNFSNRWSKAIELIEEKLNNATLRDSERALLSLSLSMFYFQQGDLDEVKRMLNSFNRTDNWYLKQMGNEWLFNFKAIEVLLHFDLGNDLLAESKILSFQRKYARHFKTDKDNPLWPFLQLVKSVLYSPEDIGTSEFVQKVEDAMPWRGEQEDFFNMCFYGWLKAKMIKRPIYEVTLELLNFNDNSE